MKASRSRFFAHFLAIAISSMAFTALAWAEEQASQPGCTVPFARIAEHRAIDDRCGLDGGSSVPLVQVQDRVKNNFCAMGAPVTLTQADFVKLQDTVEQRGISFGSTGRHHKRACDRLWVSNSHPRRHHRLHGRPII